MDEKVFRREVEREGYREPVLLEWEAGKFVDTHTHDFDARILVLSGELSVTSDGEERTCGAGDTNSIAANTPHLERVGTQGVSFLVARR